MPANPNPYELPFHALGKRLRELGYKGGISLQCLLTSKTALPPQFNGAKLCLKHTGIFEDDQYGNKLSWMAAYDNFFQCGTSPEEAARRLLIKVLEHKRSTPDAA